MMPDEISQGPSSAADASIGPSPAAAATPVLHLPAFTATDVAPWFQRVEALFRLQNVKSSSTKADYIIGALPAEVFSRVSRWLASKGSNTIIYSELKTTIIRQHTFFKPINLTSKFSRAGRLLRGRHLPQGWSLVVATS